MATIAPIFVNDNKLTAWQRRVNHVYCQLFSGIREFRLVTTQGVEAVLKHTPRNPRSITMPELNRINRHLLVPLTPETIQEILKIAREYDRELVVACDNVVRMKKPPVSTKHESDYDQHNPIFKEPRYA